MPLRALLIASLCCGAFAFGRQPSARYATKLFEGGGETGDGLSLNRRRRRRKAAPSGCPSELKGVMFNHISKTGGSLLCIPSYIDSCMGYAKSYKKSQRRNYDDMRSYT